MPFESVVVFSDSEYGLEVSAVPTLVPSTRNCTLCTPTLSEALAVTVTVPASERVRRRGGDRDAGRGRVGRVTTTVAWLDAGLALPAASAATTL